MAARPYLPFTEEQRALVARDALLEGRLLVAEDDGTRALREQYRTLMRAVHDSYRNKHPRATRSGTDGDTWQRWTTQVMMRTVYRIRGEHDYVCLLCRESVDTLPNRGIGRLPHEYVRKLETHGAACALSFVLGEFEPRGPRKGDRR